MLGKKKQNKQLQPYLLVLVLILFLTGCANPQSAGDKNPPAPDDTMPDLGTGMGVKGDNLEEGAPAPLPPDVEPNEVGKIMILMYHQIGEPEGEWTRTPDNFRRDLERLYEAGYRPISLTDLLDNDIKVTAGCTPIVITFDDGTRGQFNYLVDKGKTSIDPDSAVGILEEFSREHPDFRPAATFYIYYGSPFGQAEFRAEKLRYLVEQGFEIGNHSYSHTNLGQLDADGVKKELALHVKATRDYLPGYEVLSLALPFGAAPAERSLLVEGHYQGQAYHNEAILLVGAEPAPAPNRRGYDPHRLPRIRADAEQLEKWLTYFENNPGERYISDGDPDLITLPAAKEELVERESLRDKELRIY